MMGDRVTVTDEHCPRNDVVCECLRRERQHQACKQDQQRNAGFHILSPSVARQGQNALGALNTT